MSKIWMGIAAVIVVAAVGVGAWWFLSAKDAPPMPGQVAVQLPPSSTLPAKPVVGPEDRVLGSADAKVTIVEYASLTCPHCARFSAETVTMLQKEYIADGRVRLVFRDFPLDQAALRAAALARCVAPERYFGMIETLFESQASWGTAQDPVEALVKLAAVGGLSEETARTCLTDPARLDKVVAERLQGEREFKVDATPTIIVENRRFSGELTPDQMRAVLAPLLR